MSDATLCREEKRGEEILHFTIWPRTSIRNPAPGVNKIYNFGRPFLGLHYDTLSFADLCLGVKKFFFKRNNAFSQYDLYGHALAQDLGCRSGGAVG